MNMTAATIFPLLTGEHVDDVTVKDLVLDGRRQANAHINGNFSGAVFIQSCNRWRFQNVVAREYNGDGFSFQVCDDVQFQNCQALRNADRDKPGIGVDIQGQTADIVVSRVRFENTAGGRQTIALRIGQDAQRVDLQENTFTGCPTEVEDHRPQSQSGKVPAPGR